MFNNRRIIASLALIFTFAGLSSVAYGITRTWVTTDDTVHVCIKADGAMKAVQNDDDCKKHEELVVLSVGSGAVGATGVQGAQGDTGAQGATGVVGPRGAQGDTGAQGATGAQGLSGAPGDTGIQGATGMQGPQGDTGAQGATGAQGPNGAQGATGVPGAPGTTGQSVTTATSTSSVSLSAQAGGPVAVPGLRAVVTVPSTSSVVSVSTDGGIAIGGSFVGDYVAVDIRVLLDGVPVATRGYDLELGRFAFRGSWSYAFAIAATPGQHTLTVDASLPRASGLNGTSPTATVAGTSSSLGHGTLTVLVVNR